MQLKWGWASWPAHFQQYKFLNDLTFIFRTRHLSILQFLFSFHIDSRFVRTHKEKERKRTKENECMLFSTSLYKYHDCNCGAIFVLTIKSQVIMKSRDHARVRGIEGQVKEEEKVWRVRSGYCTGCIASDLVQHCTKRLMMHLGILVEPIEWRRVLAERLTLALGAVHSYSVGFNLICWSRRSWFDPISIFICIDILRVSFENWSF